MSSKASVISRFSNKPEIQFTFRKYPEHPHITGWVSVSVPAKNKEFGQKNTFEVSPINGTWDGTRLEDLSVKHRSLDAELEESRLSQPVLPDLRRPFTNESMEKFELARKKWDEWRGRNDSARRTFDEVRAELASLEAALAAGPIASGMLDRVIPLWNKQGDERNYILYRSAVWCSARDLTHEQWKILVDRFIEREDAELAAALSPPTLGKSGPARKSIPPECRPILAPLKQGEVTKFPRQPSAPPLLPSLSSTSPDDRDDRDFEDICQSIPLGLTIVAAKLDHFETLRSFCFSLKGAAIRLGSNAMFFLWHYSKRNWLIKGPDDNFRMPRNSGAIPLRWQRSRLSHASKAKLSL